MSAPNFSDSDATTGLYSYYDSVSLEAAICGAVACSILAFLHTALFFRHQTWYLWAFYLGVYVETAGFIVHAVSASKESHEAAFMAAYTTTLLGPTLMAIGCHATFSRLVLWVTPLDCQSVRKLWCPIRFVNIIFTSLGMLVFFFLVLGAGIVSSAYSLEYGFVDRQALGLRVLRIGVILQLLVLGFFLTISVRFSAVSSCWVTRTTPFASAFVVKWRNLLHSISMATLLITVHTAFRCAELFDFGNRIGYVDSMEWPFWTFGAVPILLAIFLLSMVFPGTYLPAQLTGFRLEKRRLRREAKNAHSPFKETELEAR